MSGHTQPSSQPGIPSVCISCGRFFPHIHSNPCGRCKDHIAGEAETGTQCPECGRLFQRLTDPCCGYCMQDGYGPETQSSGLVQHIRGVVREPNNPRQPNPDLHRFACPLPVPSQTNAAESERSHEILNGLAQAYSRAREASNNPASLQRSKVPSALNIGSYRPSSKAPTQITVSVDRLLLQTENKVEKIEWATHAKAYLVTTSWASIVSTWAKVIQEHITSRYSLMIEAKQVTLCSSKNTTAITFVDEWTTKTLGYLWSRLIEPTNNNLYVPGKEATRNTPTLHCTGYISLTGPQSLEFKQFRQAMRKDFRKAQGPTSRGTLKLESEIGSFSSTGGPSTYLSQVVHAENILVKRWDMNLGADNVTSIVKSDEPLTLEISLENQSMGLTKHMYRAVLGSEVFAAKCFYNVGTSKNVSVEENQRHLESELARHVLATKIGQEFLKHAELKNVQVYDFSFSESWIAVVQGGTRQGWSYLMAPMLDVKQLVKFSGTIKAGNNDTIMGRTMDAFAHFSLVYTNGELVLTDIQGIVSPQFNEGFKVADLLTLFDLMTHTVSKHSGLGDSGQLGIDEFKGQHICNTFCKRLALDEFEGLKSKRSRLFFSTSTNVFGGDSIIDSQLPGTTVSGHSYGLRKRSRIQSGLSSKKISRISGPNSTAASQIEDVGRNDEENDGMDDAVVYNIEINEWVGPHIDERGELVEGEVIPKDSEKNKGFLKIACDKQELYNLKRLLWWKASVSNDSTSGAYTRGIAFAPVISEQDLNRADIHRELRRFFNLVILYEGFAVLSKEKNMDIAELLFDYKLIRILDEKIGIKEWLWSPVTQYTSIFYTDQDSQPENALINETLGALSHYSYESSNKQMVHTGWAYMKTDTKEARVLAATTHDIRPISSDDISNSCPEVYIYPFDFGSTGIDFWLKCHECGHICKTLGFSNIH